MIAESAPEKVVVKDRPAHISDDESADIERAAQAVIAKQSGEEVKPYFKLKTFKELRLLDLQQRYLIKGVLCESQNAILAGMFKTLKTSIGLDAAVSLASGTPFLNTFEVPTPVRTLFLSGESGDYTIRETAIRIIADQKREFIHHDWEENLITSEQVPYLENMKHIEELGKILKDNAIKVVFADPAYLMLDGEGAANVFKMGSQLRKFADLAASANCTPILIHHAKKATLNAAEFQPLELADLAWAGFAEFARQWILLSRRSRYVEGSGEHRLWVSVGGSAGHNGCWALDVNEGHPDDDGGRHWDVSIAMAQDAKKMAAKEIAERKEQAAKQKEQVKLEANIQKIVEAFQGKRPAILTKSSIRDRSGLNSASANTAIAYMVRVGRLLDGRKIKAPNGQSYDAYELNLESPSDE